MTKTTTDRIDLDLVDQLLSEVVRQKWTPCETFRRWLAAS